MIKSTIKMLLASVFISFATMIAKNIDQTNYNNPAKLYHKISQSFLDAKINLVQVMNLSGLSEQKASIKSEITTENFGHIFKNEQVSTPKSIAEEIIAEQFQQENNNNQKIGEIFKANSKNNKTITGEIFKNEQNPNLNQDLSNNKFSLEKLINEKSLKENLQIAKESLANVEKHIGAINNGLSKADQNITHHNNNISLIPLLEQLGNQGSNPAQFILGMLYQYGFLVSQDKNKAIEWYRKAALQGNASAKEKIKSLVENN